jgi:hypothetical protein
LLWSAIDPSDTSLRRCNTALLVTCDLIRFSSIHIKMLLQSH